MCASLLLLLLPLGARAASGYRAAAIDEVQMNSASVIEASLMYVAQPGVWTGSANCPTQWVYFNAKENPHFAATVLAARMADKVLRVYVDDSLPKVGGYCQISYLSLLPG